MEIRGLARYFGKSSIVRASAVRRRFGRILFLLALFGVGFAIQHSLSINDQMLFGILSKTRFSTRAQGGLPCLNGGDHQTIMNRLAQTRNAQGEFGQAKLCQGSTFNLSETIRLRTGDEIYTEGNPTDNSRALLKIVVDISPNPIDPSPYLGMAILASKVNALNGSEPLIHNTYIHHIRVDGGRRELGVAPFARGLITTGFGNGHRVEWVEASHTRSWSSIVMEGGAACNLGQVMNNMVGPAGFPDGTWADGISFDCRDSKVKYNTIIDATDGAIVVFGATGSEISYNTIKAKTRTLLGGINMVDLGANFTGTIVHSNTIDAESAPIKIGIGIGTRIWWCPDFPETAGGIVAGNVFKGLFMGYGIAVSGANNFQVKGGTYNHPMGTFILPDNISEAVHTAAPDCGCANKIPAPPKAFQRTPAFSGSSGNYQANFQLDNVDFALGSKAIELAGGADL